MATNNAALSISDLYQQYLEELCREIDDAGCRDPLESQPVTASLIKPRDGADNKAIVYTIPTERPSVRPPPPPYPPIWKNIPQYAVTNISGAVGTYCRFVRPEKTGGRKKRFARIFQVAKQAAVNHGHFRRNDKSLPALSILKPHLTADVLYCSGISPEQESHLDYFMLVSIQLWLMSRELRTISAEQLFWTSLELNKSIERGFAEKRLNTVLAVLPKRLRAVAIKAAEDEKKEAQYRNAALGADGGGKKDEIYYAECRRYARRFYSRIYRCKKYKQLKAIARDMQPRLVKKVDAGKFKACPTYNVLLQYWLPEFKKELKPTP
ncbi:MAG: hypothetical protein SFW64_09060 [Alphaproteobacteria bacterium]|nr:hypothetical protein [Alphaproteobacteria bacterium]